jgi:ribosome-binding factor A
MIAPFVWRFVAGSGGRLKPGVAVAGVCAYVRGMSNRRPHTSSGPSQRQLRVGELIRRTLSEVLARGDVHDPDLNVIPITVGEVTVSPDLKVATVYVMPLLGTAPVDVAIAALARHRGELRHHVAGAMRLKYAPDLRFRADETFDRLDETRRMFADERVQRDLDAPDED